MSSNKSISHCKVCGAFGHKAYNCFSDEKSISVYCAKCGLQGHWAINCKNDLRNSFQTCYVCKSNTGVHYMNCRNKYFDLRIRAPERSNPIGLEAAQKRLEKRRIQLEREKKEREEREEKRKKEDALKLAQKIEFERTATKVKFQYISVMFQTQTKEDSRYYEDACCHRPSTPEVEKTNIVENLKITCEECLLDKDLSDKEILEHVEFNSWSEHTLLKVVIKRFNEEPKELSVDGGVNFWNKW